MKMYLSAHGKDLCNISVTDEKDETIFDKDGYLPYLKGIGGGDDLVIEVDVETGKIIGWDVEHIKEYIEMAKTHATKMRSHPRTYKDSDEYEEFMNM